MCLDVLNGSGGVANFNNMLIALISKIPSPSWVTKLRLISLCNVLYKIISKVIANRLMTALPSVIFEFQSAFIANRMILDNVLVAFETIHCLKHRGKSGKRKIVLKHNMAKAYDRVEWVFLKHMMCTMEFPDRFIQLIMGCITFVSYSLQLHGQPSGHTITTRGLH